MSQAERRYAENGTAENWADFQRVLRIFRALVMRGVVQRDDDMGNNRLLALIGERLSLTALAPCRSLLLLHDCRSNLKRLL